MGKSFHFCSRCGYQNRLSNNFCARCGERLKSTADIAGKQSAVPQAAAVQSETKAPPAAQSQETKCPNCGYPNPADSTYCRNCSITITQEVSVEDHEDYIYIQINVDQLDFENHKVLPPIFKAVTRKKMIVDISKVDWMDSTGIGTLVTQAYRAARTKQEVKFVGMQKKVFKAVKALQVDNVLELYDNINAARADWGLPPV